MSSKLKRSCFLLTFSLLIYIYLSISNSFQFLCKVLLYLTRLNLIFFDVFLHVHVQNLPNEHAILKVVHLSPSQLKTIYDPFEPLNDRISFEKHVCIFTMGQSIMYVLIFAEFLTTPPPQHFPLCVLYVM